MTAKKATTYKLEVGPVHFSGGVPVVPICATEMQGRKVIARWVLLDYEQRMDLHREFGRGVTLTPADKHFPAYVLREDGKLAAHYGGVRPLGRGWTNAESIFVHEDAARDILAALFAWRAAHPPQEGLIWAPSWRTLTTIRGIAWALDEPDPIRPEDLG